jgi:ABC-type branched-subunit amino acid transport system substrate-binding protein
LVVLLATVAAACGRSDDNTSGGSSGGNNGTAGGSGGTAAPPTAGTGFDGTTIKLGVITPVTGSAAVIGNPLTAGNKVYFDRINAAGGIAGKYKVDLEVLDSKYDAPTAVQQYQASKGNVVAYVQILGTGMVDAILPQLDSDGILAGPASLDAFWVREPDLMPIGGPYQIQVINGMDYAVRNLDAKSKTICALTKDDPYGETGLAGLEYAAEQMDFEIASQATFKQGDTDFTAQINQLQGANCEIVVFVGLPTETSPVLTSAAGRGFAPKWLGQSPTWLSAFANPASDLAPYLQANFLLLSEGPQWGDTSVPGMAQMLDDITAYAPEQKPDIYFAFGYSQAWAMAQILEKAVADGDLSPAGVLTASSEISELTFEGLLGDYTYGPVADRNPPRTSTVFGVDPNVPGGLKALEADFSSQAAKDYEFNE